MAHVEERREVALCSEMQELLENLGFSDDYPGKATIQNVMAIGPPFNEHKKENKFAKKVLRDIISLDFRGRKGYAAEKEEDDVVANGRELLEEDEDDIFAVFQSGDVEEEALDESVSTLDVMHAIYHCCNPFFRQDLFCKMAKCQMAVPLILPDFNTNKVSFLLWSLRKIHKKRSLHNSNQEIVKKPLASTPLSIISFVRLGSPKFSKTKLLNIFIGPHQGNNEHPYFVDKEHDIGCPKLSKGTVEIIWYMQSGREDSDKIMKDHVAFLNLRGDALNFPKQLGFVSKFSNITVAVLGEDKRLQKEALSIAGNKNNHLVVINTHTLERKKKQKTVTRGNITIVDGSGQSVINLCHEMSSLFKKILATHGNGSQTHTFKDIAKCCTGVEIEIDEKSQECVLAKRIVDDVLAPIYPLEGIKKTSPVEYKQSVLPLQTTIWKEWVHLDRKLENLIQGTYNKSVEKILDEMARKKKSQRKLQINFMVSDEITKVIKALQSEENQREYFWTWLKICLDDMNQEVLGPLLKRLQNEHHHLSSSYRDLEETVSEEQDMFEGKEITMESDLCIWIEDTKLDEQLQQLDEDDEQEEEELQQREDEKEEEQHKDHEEENHTVENNDGEHLGSIKRITKEIDDNNLQPEHFVREIGQIFEAYMETKEINVEEPDFDVHSLPHLVANMLINGHPIEVLDGDVGHMSIKWINAVLKSVSKTLHNPKIYVVSIIGSQGSGKSTLLNNMFGLSFRISDYKFSKGVFLQMLPVLSKYRHEIGCDYVFVLDTEGLKPPSQELSNSNLANVELATFAVCLSDMCLVNISGHATEDEIKNSLQVAARAFIRKKEVNLRVSCKIVRHLVSDFSAVDGRNTENQSFLAKLNDATTNAAAKEDLGYQKFSEIFNLKPDFHYIPNLYGSAMSPPNHRYCDAVERLKDAIVNDIRGSAREMPRFCSNISDVWFATKRENFIFHFQNSNSALEYKMLQFEYGKWVSDFRCTLMEWEITAMQIMKNTPRDSLETKRDQLQEWANTVVTDAKEEVEKKINHYTDEKIKDDINLPKYESEFYEDLSLMEKEMRKTCLGNIHRLADTLTQGRDPYVNLPRCRAEISSRAQEVALNLRQEHEVQDLKKEDIDLNKKFESLWDTWIIDIKKNYPIIIPKDEDVAKEFDQFITEQGSKTELTRELERRLQEGGGGLLRYLKSPFKKLLYGVNVNTVIDRELKFLSEKIRERNAYENDIVPLLINHSVSNLNKDVAGGYLKKDMKVNALIEICAKAVGIIREERKKYDEEHSLRNILKKEKNQVLNDFVALCSGYFQDQRAAERFYICIKETILDVVSETFGLAIYRSACEKYPFLTNKFRLLGTVLYNIGEKGDCKNYSEYVLENRKFVGKWVLCFLADMVIAHDKDDKTFMDNLVLSKLENMIATTLHVLSTATDLYQQSQNSNDSFEFGRWLTSFEEVYEADTGIASVSGIFNVLRGFSVESYTFFRDKVQQLIESDILEECKTESGLYGIITVEKAKAILSSLPVKPHVEIMSNVQGCDAHCPLCKAPCDLMTTNHEKHRSQLHFPEGIVESAARRNRKLSCEICSSSVASGRTYVECGIEKKYKDYVTVYPDWYIQPVRDDAPDLYWKWVFNVFNEDFAKLYGVENADIPIGWKDITKEQALASLKEAYSL